MQPEDVHRVSKPVRRARNPLSCEACRSRKLKCNRDKPCQNCSVRGEQTACVYKGSVNGSAPQHSQHRTGDPMRQRIDRLEDMVKKLITQSKDTPSTPPRETYNSVDESVISPDLLRQVGTTVIEAGHSVYKATDDWHDVLKEINDLKADWNLTQDDTHDVQHPLPNTVDGTSLLFGARGVEMDEILSSIPPKHEVDKLIRWFFDRNTFPITIPPILHEPTFMREYSEYWSNFSQRSVIWVGLLFSILGITVLAHQLGEPPEYEEILESRFHLYRLRTAQCLLTGDIAKCLPYTIETLRFNATAELNRKDDNSRGLWIMTGVIVRAAVNMGYHRDPSHTPKFSILQAEYRRRVWLSVISMDEVASFMSGFPRMLPSLHADTQEPRNLHDWELTEDATVLPPSRPLSEATPATYLIAKGRLFYGLGTIIEFVNNPRPGSYREVLEINQLLHDTYSTLPAHLKLDPSTLDQSSFRKPADYSSLQSMCMYHHGLITLHRKYIPKEGNAAGNISRAQCIHSALALLNYQRLLAPAWYASAPTRQMLARAALVILLELEFRRRGCDNPDVSTECLLQALENSVSLWDLSKGSCEDAVKVHRLIDSLLSSFKTQSADCVPVENVQPFDIDIFDFPSGKDIDWASFDQLIDPSLFEQS
ncbi:hypothetical protein BJX99DRAFT_82171 [Aspergillus californicus]